MKKKSAYVIKRLKEIDLEERRKKRPPRKVVIKTVLFSMKTKGFYLSMELNPKDSFDMEIMNEAVKLILRRAS